ncbi:MAG: hypothetical protein R3E79_15380 [Caldilineaceae bacterium]
MVLAGYGEQKSAQQALQDAAAWVELVAGRISDEAVRTAFLARPDVQQLQRRRQGNRKP